MKVQQEQSSSRSTRQRHGPQLASSLAEINVVPLVDVMLVLLIIFMVTAPMMQRGLDVNVPASRQSQVINAERVFVTVPVSYRQDRRVQIGDDIVRIDVLSERLRQALLNQPEKQVYLRGDGTVMFQELMDVMDKLKEAGVEKIGIVTQLPEERRR